MRRRLRFVWPRRRCGAPSTRRLRVHVCVLCCTVCVWHHTNQLRIEPPLPPPLLSHSAGWRLVCTTPHPQPLRNHRKLNCTCTIRANAAAACGCRRPVGFWLGRIVGGGYGRGLVYRNLSTVQTANGFRTGLAWHNYGACPLEPPSSSAVGWQACMCRSDVGYCMCTYMHGVYGVHACCAVESTGVRHEHTHTHTFT